MCGIAGRILSAPGQVGRDLVALMAAQAFAYTLIAAGLFALARLALGYAQ